MNQEQIDLANGLRPEFGTTVETVYDHSSDPPTCRIRIFLGNDRWLTLTPSAVAELVAALNANLAICWGNRSADDRILARVEHHPLRTAKVA